MSSSDLPLNGEYLAFTNFAKLPPELRFMIWKEAAHVPQLIGLECEAAVDNFKGNHIRCPLLLVNKEARREVLRYKKDLDVSEGRWDQDRSPVIFPNLDTEIIWMRPKKSDHYRNVLDNITRGRWQEVRRLAIDYLLFLDLFHFIYIFHKAKYIFQFNLEEIILLVSDEIDDSRLKLVAALKKDILKRRNNGAQAILDHFNRAKIIRESGPTDLSDWKVPKITVLHFKNFTPTSCQ